MARHVPLIARRLLFVLPVLLLSFFFFGSAYVPETLAQGPDTAARQAYFDRVEADRLSMPELEPAAATPCVNGSAAGYPCENIDLLSQLPLSSMGGGGGTDIWGWTDPQDGTEYALFARTNGSAFVDVSDPEDPIYLGNLPSHTGSSSWRDIKVYENHAFIVSDLNGSHGIQVFDLTQLRNVTNPPVTFAETAHYDGIGSAHNIAINEDTGFAYAVGANSCSGGLHMVNIQTPISPSFAGCFSADGYTHDVQCVIYSGPDTQHQGDEICFAANEDTLTIVDVTDKSNPVQLSRNPYSGDGYSHQGWLTEDQSHFLLSDELDEINFGHNTRTRVWDVSDLESPQIVEVYDGPTGAIDHNLYTHEDRAYESNYTAGLRILDLSDITDLQEVAYFDVHPQNNNSSFNGSWSNYPYFESGIVIVSSRELGLFVLQPTFGPALVTQIDYSYSLSSGSSGNGTFSLFNDLSFTDASDEEGDWLYRPVQQRLFLRYDPGEFCDALFIGQVSAPASVSGILFCRDGSGVTGTWSGTFGTEINLGELSVE